MSPLRIPSFHCIVAPKNIDAHHLAGRRATLLVRERRPRTAPSPGRQPPRGGPHARTSGVRLLRSARGAARPRGADQWARLRGARYANHCRTRPRHTPAGSAPAVAHRGFRGLVAWPRARCGRGPLRRRAWARVPTALRPVARGAGHCARHSPRRPRARRARGGAGRRAGRGVSHPPATSQPATHRRGGRSARAQNHSRPKRAAAQPCACRVRKSREPRATRRAAGFGWGAGGSGSSAGRLALASGCGRARAQPRTHAGRHCPVCAHDKCQPAK